MGKKNKRDSNLRKAAFCTKFLKVNLERRSLLVASAPAKLLWLKPSLAKYIRNSIVFEPAKFLTGKGWTKRWRRASTQ